MIPQPDPMPDRLALLADVNAAANLTSEVLSGRENPPYIALGKDSVRLESTAARFAVGPIRALVEDARTYGDMNRKTDADAWLAPRLHATLRLTRREAADRRLWNHLALCVAPDYVLWRHLPAEGKDGNPARVNPKRFSGSHFTQVFSRLWWAAELFRDGADYAPVEVACGNQDIFNTILRLDVIDHRPTVQAMIRLHQQGVVRTGREVNALAAAVNAAASTLLYDVIAPDGERDGDALTEWIEEAESAPPVSRKRLPDGPDDGPVPRESTELLVERFAEYFETAPVRGQIKKEEAEKE
ncbi:DUF6339 family protein [Streptomyces sp. NPDC020875]|uniref:DUF6339 family protein n=1 Tax=Streptomyces sp. NPDC020875 TaxID=3154898 RepID=UPI0033EF5AF8